MNHQEIEQQEIIERYVRRQLPPAERRAFQEHYFDCEDCFEQVQTTARFIAGVRHAARQEAPSTVVTEKVAWWAGSLRPAIGFAVAVAFILTVAFGWYFFKFKQSSPPSHEEARSQPLNQEPRQTASPEQPTVPQPENGKNEQPRPQNSPRSPNPEAQPDLLAQNHTPTVLLESSRDATTGGSQLMIPPNATKAILRFETEPGTRFQNFQLQLFDSMRRPIATINDVKTRANGALAASLPARLLAPGKYRVRLFGMKGEERSLVGEYDLTVIQK
jgi:hypothetical protein